MVQYFKKFKIKYKIKLEYLSYEERPRELGLFRVEMTERVPCQCL